MEGKILAAQYAREHKVPYLGLCLGMQVAIIEFARHVCGFNDAHSVELDPNTTHPVIALMPDQNGVEDIGGTLRLVLIHVFWTRLLKLMNCMALKILKNVTAIVTK